MRIFHSLVFVFCGLLAACQSPQERQAAELQRTLKQLTRELQKQLALRLRSMQTPAGRPKSGDGGEGDPAAAEASAAETERRIELLEKQIELLLAQLEAQIDRMAAEPWPGDGPAPAAPGKP